MSRTFDQMLSDMLVMVVASVGMGCVIALVVHRLRRSRPDFAIGVAAGVAFAIRIVASGVVALTPVAQTLRGGDEVGFLSKANLIADTPVGSSEWTEALFGHLHIFVFAAQRYVLDSPDLALRVTQVGIATTGLVLLAAAVYELAGARASVIAMWVLALEPTNMFFSTLLHKEANMTLASGLVAFGGALIWKRGRLSAVLPIAAGCLIAVSTRPYVGWFLIAAGAVIVLHGGLRQRRESGLRSLGLVAIVVMLVAVAAPIVLHASSDESLQTLQRSQNANTTNEEANLSLEQVDFSTRGAVIVNLPRRTFEVLVKPYPWQLGNISQQIGLVGTMVAYLALALLLAELFRMHGSVMSRAGPLIYVGGFMLIAYSLAAGNAGTAFRYRAHLVVLAICVIITLRQLRLHEARGPGYTSGAAAAGQKRSPVAPSVA